MKKTIITAICILPFLLQACKKSDTAQNGTAKLLTSAPWKQTKIEWQTTAGTWVDAVALGRAALLTTTVSFFDNNTYSFNGAGYGTWNLSGNDTQLTLLGNNGKSVTTTVATLNSSTMQLTAALDANTYTVTYTPTYSITYYSTERDTYTH